LALQPEVAAAFEISVGVLDASEKIAEGIMLLFKDHPMGPQTPIKIDWNAAIQYGKTKFFNAAENDLITIEAFPRGNGFVGFKTSDGVNWWKGIVAYNKNNVGSWAELACNQDHNNNNSGFQSSAALGRDYLVGFGKAKAWGVHNNMYVVSNWNEMPMNYNYVITWIHD
jgi:hypothetical protein